MKGGRSTTAGRGRAAIEHHHLAILRSIDGDSARGAVSRSVSLYLGRGGNNVWSDFRESLAPMSRSRDSLSRALDDRQHRSTLASQSNFVGQRDSIPFIAIYIYIYLFLLTRVDYFSSSLYDSKIKRDPSFFFAYDRWSFCRYFFLPFFYFRGNIRGAIYLSTRSLKISPRGETIVSTTSVSSESIRSFPINVITFIDNLRFVLYLSVSNIADGVSFDTKFIPKFCNIDEKCYLNFRITLIWLFHSKLIILIISCLLFIIWLDIISWI